jgi:putative transposase
MGQFAGACRFIYNLALEQRLEWYRPGRKIDVFSQSRELTQLRAEVDWIKAAPIGALQNALHDLEDAYRNWWAGKTTQRPGYRKKGQTDSFRFPYLVWNVAKAGEGSTGLIKLPKLGWVKLRRWRTLPGQIRTITVSRKAGDWFVSVQCERDVPEPAESSLPAVGIDVGVRTFCALSDGTCVAPINARQRAKGRLRKAHRVLTRKQKGSANRRKALLRLSRVHRRVANIRRDFLHKHSTTIAKKHGVVVMESLDVGAMTASAKGSAKKPGRKVRQKAGMNAAIIDQGWATFRRMIRYKLQERGGRLVEIAPHYTSQCCSSCGTVDPANRRRGDALFACVDCGHTADADTNAAINILRLGLGEPWQPVEDIRAKRPHEAGITRQSAQPIGFATGHRYKVLNGQKRPLEILESLVECR